MDAKAKAKAQRRRYKQLRKQGLTVKDAMTQSQEEIPQQAQSLPPGMNQMMALLSATNSTKEQSNITLSSKKTNNNAVTILCFSKDRPFQLKEFLRTLLHYVHNLQGTINITVLYKVDDKDDSTSTMASSYEYVGTLFPQVHMLRETNFATQLTEFVAATQQDYLMFAVDDILFYNHIELSEPIRALKSSSDIFAFHTKLHPNVSYCHPADQDSIVPRTFQRIVGTSVLVYDRTHSGCTMDWNYPWDLCCTMYRLEDVRRVLLALKEEGNGNEKGKGLTHPNLLEAEGARLLSPSFGQSQALLRSSTKCCCLASPCMSVITINRVQSIYDNPIYRKEKKKKEKKNKKVNDKEGENQNQRDRNDANEETEITKHKNPTKQKEQENQTEDGDTKVIEAEFVRDRTIELNDIYYCKQSFTSVHVGDWKLKKKRCVETKETSSSSMPSVTVLMPVYNGAKHLKEALDSLFAQTYTGPMAVVVIDDGSTDESMTIVQDFSLKLKNSTSLNSSKSMMTLHVLSNATNIGISKSLDRGISFVIEQPNMSRYVARMDADDICHPERIAMQVKRMEQLPEIDVLGTAVEIFGTTEDNANLNSNDNTNDNTNDTTNDNEKTRKIIVHPLKHEMIEWNAWFLCPMAHPSIMFRTRVLKLFKYYVSKNEINEETQMKKTCTEDYALWFRMLSSQKNVVKFENLALPLLLLRKHEGNVSRLQREKQNQDAHWVVLLALRHRFQFNKSILQYLEEKEIGLAIVACLQRPETSTTFNVAEGAVHVLLALESSFIENQTKSIAMSMPRIIQDTTARLGAMAMTALQKYGSDATKLILIWQNREGQKQ